MNVPDVPTGTQPRRGRKDLTRGDAKNIEANRKKPHGSGNGGGPASVPHGGKGGKGGKKGGKGGSMFDMEPLNPPFDPRMRKIGSPLNLTSKIKRGWIQSAEEDNQKVNFLFNPSQLDLSHQIDPSLARTDQQTPAADVMNPDYPTIGSSTGVKLLYDRTYELFSAPRSGKMGFANTYGVWADVAAWYVFLGLLSEMPDSWENSIITDPPVYKTAHLFIGPKMVFYGWVTGINVTYSHWNQLMVPSRCAVDVSFQLLPSTGEVPLPGQAPIDLFGWFGDYMLSPDGSVSNTGGQ